MKANLTCPFCTQLLGHLPMSNHIKTENYKGYTIKIQEDKDGRWHYKIEGTPRIFPDTGESFSEYFALDEAKQKVDEKTLSDW